MTTYKLDVNFGATVIVADLGGLPFSLDAAGNPCLDPSLTASQIEAIGA